MTKGKGLFSLHLPFALRLKPNACLTNTSGSQPSTRESRNCLTFRTPSSNMPTGSEGAQGP